jgi:hypothetical protein
MEICDEAFEALKFVQEMLQLFLKKTNNFKPAPTKTHLIHWFTYIREQLSILLHVTLDDKNTLMQPCFAQKSQETLTSIIDSLKSIFVY